MCYSSCRNQAGMFTLHGGTPYGTAFIIRLASGYLLFPLMYIVYNVIKTWIKRNNKPQKSQTNCTKTKIWFQLYIVSTCLPSRDHLIKCILCSSQWRYLHVPMQHMNLPKSSARTLVRISPVLSDMQRKRWGHCFVSGGCVQVTVSHSFVSVCPQYHYRRTLLMMCAVVHW